MEQETGKECGDRVFDKLRIFDAEVMGYKLMLVSLFPNRKAGFFEQSFHDPAERAVFLADVGFHFAGDEGIDVLIEVLNEAVEVSIGFHGSERKDDIF